jgi:hypothetical protein
MFQDIIILLLFQEPVQQTLDRKSGQDKTENIQAQDDQEWFVMPEFIILEFSNLPDIHHDAGC